MSALPFLSRSKRKGGQITLAELRLVKREGRVKMFFSLWRSMLVSSRDCLAGVRSISDDTMSDQASKELHFCGKLYVPHSCLFRCWKVVSKR